MADILSGYREKQDFTIILTGLSILQCVPRAITPDCCHLMQVRGRGILIIGAAIIDPVFYSRGGSSPSFPVKEENLVFLPTLFSFSTPVRTVVRRFSGNFGVPFLLK
jgi:hypothetical protein